MTLAILLVVAFALGQLQNRFRASGRPDPVTQGFRVVVTPAVEAFDSAAQSCGHAWNGLVAGPRLSREVQRLKNVEAAARLYNETVEGLSRENARLQGLMGFPDMGKQRVPARIIGYYWRENRVTLSVGKADGVTVGLPVVTPKGLLALIQTVDSRSSQATLVTSIAVTFGGIVQRNAGVAGLVKGQTPTRLVLSALEAGDVKVGDLVVTSGFSERIPRGIPVGTVVEVMPDPSYGALRVAIAPAATLDQALEVWVLR